MHNVSQGTKTEQLAVLRRPLVYLHRALAGWCLGGDAARNALPTETVGSIAVLREPCREVGTIHACEDLMAAQQGGEKA